MKKLCGALLCLFLLVSALLLTAAPARAEIVDSGSCGVNLTWTLDDSGLLTISGSGAMTDYSSSGRETRSPFNSSVKTVVINSGVTHIGDRAFSDCGGLKSVTIPSSVTSIGEWAFYTCYNLENVTIPEGVTSIGKAAFLTCRNLESVEIPSSVTSIGEWAFDECMDLRRVDITDLGAWCRISFGNVSSNPLLFSSSALYLNGERPSGSVTIPNGATLIPLNTFRNCGELTSVMIPDSVTRIENSAFRDCSGLLSLTIPDSVTEMEAYAFQSCSGLTSLTIPDSVTEIKAYAFQSCSGLTSLTLGSGLTSIGEFAFSGCSSLTSVTVPDGVTVIGYNAFSGCSSLTSLTLGSGLTSIGDYAFCLCSGLTSLSIPDAVTDIGKSAFTQCSGLTSLTLGSGLKSIGEAAFSRCSGLTSLSIPDAVTAIGNSAFTRCSGLKSVTLPDGVKSIGQDTFSECPGLTTVKLPRNLTDIGRYAFYNCSALRSMTIPDSVTSIGVSAFSCCSSLAAAKIPEGVTELRERTFWNCAALKSVDLPQSLKRVRKDAFSGCAALQDVNYNGTESEWAALNIEDGNEALLGAVLHVMPDPLCISGVESGKTTAKVGETITWTVTTSGGTGTLRCCFHVYNGSTVVWKGAYGTVNTVSYTPDAVGTWKVKVYVKDGAGTVVNAVGGEVTVTAPAVPISISSLKANRSSARVGDTITWTASATGGTGTLKYCFYVYNGSAVVQKGTYGTAQTFSYTPTEAGTFKAKVFVKDGAGTVVSKLDGAVTVGSNTTLTIESVKANTTTASIGDSITWTASATGGTGTLEYCFYVYNGSTVVKKGTYGTSKTFSYTPTEAGTYKAKVFVKDGAGTTVNLFSSAVTVRSNTPLTISSVTVNSSAADVGDTITWTASATGGTGTLKYCFYVYRGVKSNTVVQKGTYGTAKTFSFTPTEAGSYKVKVFVKDGTGAVVSLIGGTVTVS